MNQKPIGILGGTFDPIHLGHIYLANSIYKLCDLQKVLLTPCYQSPTKPQPKASKEARLSMAKLAISKLPHIEICDYEIKRASISYTYTTLEYLRQKYQDNTLALIMGMDAFSDFDHWHNWQKIIQLSHLIVVNRDNSTPQISAILTELITTRKTSDISQLQKNPSGLIYQADIAPLPITATKIRELIKQQKDASHLVDSKVLDYIKINQLYLD